MTVLMLSYMLLPSYAAGQVATAVTTVKTWVNGYCGFRVDGATPKMNVRFLIERVHINHLLGRAMCHLLISTPN